MKVSENSKKWSLSCAENKESYKARKRSKESWTWTDPMWNILRTKVNIFFFLPKNQSKLKKNPK